MAQRSAKAKVLWLVAVAALVTFIAIQWWRAGVQSDTSATDEVARAGSETPPAAGSQSSGPPKKTEMPAASPEPVKSASDDSRTSASTSLGPEPASASVTTAGAPGLSTLTGTRNNAGDAAEAERFPRDWRRCSPMSGGAIAGYRIASDSTNVWRGSASVQIASREARPNPAGAALCQWVSAAAFKGRRVAFSAQMQTVRATPGAHLIFRADSADSQVVAFSTMSRHWIPGTTAWAHHSIVIDVPEKAALIMIGVALVNTGSVWVDDVALDVVDHNWPVTESAPPVIRFGAPADPASVQKQLKNPGFEETVPLPANGR